MGGSDSGCSKECDANPKDVDLPRSHPIPRPLPSQLLHDEECLEIVEITPMSITEEIL